MTLTKDEFEETYAARSNMTVEQLHEHGLHAEPCDCSEEGCAGWKISGPPPRKDDA